MVSFDGGSACKVDDVTALPSHIKMADMRYYGNVMTTTRWRLYVILHLQQYSHRLNLFFFYSETVLTFWISLVQFGVISIRIHCKSWVLQYEQWDILCTIGFMLWPLEISLTENWLSHCLHHYMTVTLCWFYSAFLAVIRQLHKISC